MIKHHYSDAIHNKKIAVLGLYPPPLGGISVHIKRVMLKLKNQGNTTNFFCTEPFIRKLFPLYCLRLAWFLIRVRPDIIQYHAMYVKHSLWEMKLLVYLKKWFSFKITVIEHNCRYLYKKNEKWKFQFNMLIPRIDRMVIIGNSTHKSYRNNGIMLSTHYSIESSFLPPDMCEHLAIMQTYPQSLFTFLQAHTPVIAANASNLILLDGAKDLYGVDVCIDLIANLKKEYPTIGLIFAIACVRDQVYFDELQNKIEQLGLQKNIYFLCGHKELWPLLKKADLFVRPTILDSYGISVAEALMLGTPAVASDVCVRPEGTILYKAGDQEDFTKKVKTVLQRKMYEATNKQCDTLHAQQN